MKTLKINIPQGFQIDQKKSTFEEIVFKPIEDEWGDSREGLERISGFYISEDSDIIPCDGNYTDKQHKAIFPEWKDAKSVLALAQLLQLRKRVIGDWVADWEKNNGNKKYVIYRENFDLISDWFFHQHYELSFPTAEMRDKFSDKYRDLINIYFKLS